MGHRHVVQGDQNGNRRHAFLGPHADGTDRDSGGGPQRFSTLALSRANGRIERGQRTERHHRFGPLRDVVHDFARQRVHKPQRRDRERGESALRTVFGSERCRTAKHGEEQDAAEHVHRQVPGVEASRRQAAEREVDGHRHADDRPSGERGLRRRCRGCGQRPEVPDVLVADDGGEVVVDETERQAAGVCGHTGGDERREISPR